MATGNSERARGWALGCGARYFGDGSAKVTALPMPSVDSIGLGRGFETVSLPDWAADLGVEGRILVDAASIQSGDGEPWRRCDWLTAIFAHLTGAFERRQEDARGPILSYSFRLHLAPRSLFDHAWTNRIFLFLRRWAAQCTKRSELELFGPLPHAEIILTHDVDAIRKTPEIRLKQGLFHFWNAGRAAISGQAGGAARSLAAGFRFAMGGGNFETLSEVRALERDRGLRSVLHFYAGPAGVARLSPTRLLIDPGYDIRNAYLLGELRAFTEGGWTIGLHQSTAAWVDADAMERERAGLAGASGIEPVHCRQHWLRFSWKNTWAAQQRAGFRLDSTLGFNDRPGFRNGAALRFHPWDAACGRPMEIEAMPMIFMDSHFYDYTPLTPEARRAELARWIAEVRAVGGEATVNWHTHTIGAAYGWGEGFRELVDMLAG